MGLTLELAEFAASLRPEDVPAAVRRKVVLHTLDQLGAELAGSTQPWNAVVREYALAESPDGPSTVVSAERSLRPEWAALANATAGHGFEIDDYHAAALSHPGCVAVPAVLAVAEELGTSGTDAVLALALGFEVIVRIGLAVQPSMIYDRGFHETCAEGVFGAAAAVGKLRGLDRDTLGSALGIAGSHASGTTEYSQTGSEVKRLHAGIGAMGGIRGVSLAMRGFEGPRTILEGKRGFLQAFADTTRPEAIVDGLGQRWDLLDAAIKPYFCCGLIHAPIDALRALIDEEGLTADDVEEIVVGADHLSLVHVGKLGPRPHDMTAAQFSMEFSLGMALAGGGNDFGAYLAAQQDGFANEHVRQVAERVRLELDQEADTAFPKSFLARVRVRRRSGGWIERKAYATGSPDAPMSEEAVRLKFHSIAARVIGVERAAQVDAAVHALLDGGPTRAVTEPLRFAPGEGMDS
jgi:2-methylcitrate dehydratase PrpD